MLKASSDMGVQAAVDQYVEYVGQTANSIDDVVAKLQAERDQLSVMSNRSIATRSIRFETSCWMPIDWPTCWAANTEPL